MFLVEKKKKATSDNNSKKHTDSFLDLLREVREDLRKGLAGLLVFLVVLIQLGAAHGAGEALQAHLALDRILALLVLLEVLGGVLLTRALRLLHLTLAALVRTATVSRRHFFFFF
jgi:hypothetical protein